MPKPQPKASIPLPEYNLPDQLHLLLQPHGIDPVSEILQICPPDRFTREQMELAASIATDRRFRQIRHKDPNNPAAYADVRAIALLKELGVRTLPFAERLLCLFTSWDDELENAAQSYFLALGPPVLPLLTRTMRQRMPKIDPEENPSLFLCDILAGIAEQNPSCRRSVIQLLEDVVMNEAQLPETVTHAVNSLTDLHSRQSLPFIEMAYANSRIDHEFASSLEDVRDILLNAGRKDVSDAAAPLSAAPAHNPPIRKNLPGRNDPCPCGSGKKYKKCCADVKEN